MATAVYVVLDVPARRLEVVSAGHPPPLLADFCGPVRYLELYSNVPLGVLDAPTFRSSTFDLEPGSVLLFYTDGLVESSALPLQDGLDQLLKVMRAAGPDVGVDGLLATVLAPMMSEGTQDDVAVLAARID